MSSAQATAAIRVRLPDAHIEWADAAASSVLMVSPANLLGAAEMLRDEPELKCDLLLAAALCGGQMCYQLASTAHKHRIRLQTTLPEAPALLSSLAFVWPAASWLEREVRDTSGLDFAGHSDPEPLLRPTHITPTLPLDASRDTFLHGTRYPTSIDGLSLALQVHEDRVEALRPELGRRHIGLGQHLTRCRHSEGTALAARLDGFAALSCDLAYALAIEALLGVEVPLRAQVLRSLYAELARLASHLFWLARFVGDATGPSFVGPSYALQGRDAILELFEQLGGNPIIPDLITVGGLKQDIPAGLRDAARQVTSYLTELLDELDRLIGSVLQAGLRGVGVIDAGTAVGLGVTGPCLRASGVVYDVRRAFPYAGYPLLDLEIPTMETGDAAARCQVRLAEMRCSVDIVQQCLARLETGPVDAFGAAGPPGELPRGTAYAAVEGPRGELGVLVATGSGEHLESAYVRGPSFANLSALPLLAPGTHLVQLRLLVDSLDLSAGEVER